MVDSIMVAVCLWKHTGRSGYIEDAHHIYYNAFCHQQRTNGGFGSDNCAGACDGHERQFVTPNNYETFWCCTMRAGEGFARASEYLYFTDGNTVLIPFYGPSTATLRLPAGTLTIEQKTRYPYDGSVRLEIVEGSASGICLRFFVGSWAKFVGARVNGAPVAAKVNEGFVSISGSFQKGDTIAVRTEMETTTNETTFKNSIKPFFSFRFGPLVLAYKRKAILESERFINAMRGVEKNFICPEPIQIPEDVRLESLGNGRFRIADTDFVLSPLCDIKELTREDSADQILFAR